MRSRVTFSGMTTFTGYPLCLQIIASEMPVLPDVGSRIVCPGRIRPLSSASSIIARATRSLTDPVGLRDSSLAHSRTPGFGLRRLSSTSGVCPIAWMMSP